MMTCFPVRRAFRAAAALLCAVSLFAAASCGGKETHGLAYQKYPLTADCTLINEKENALPERVGFTLEMSRAGSGIITFGEDSALCGASAEIAGEKIVFRSQEYEIPLDCPEGAPLAAVTAAFSLDPAQTLPRPPEGENGVESTLYSCAGGTVEITLDKGIPVLMKFENGCGAFSVRVDRFQGAGSD